jgi:hypothetical protein
MVKYHYWNKFKDECECGCKFRVVANKKWVCLERLREELAAQGLNLMWLKKDE